MHAEEIQLFSVGDDTPVNSHRSAEYRELHKSSHLADAVRDRRPPRHPLQPAVRPYPFGRHRNRRAEGERPHPRRATCPEYGLEPCAIPRRRTGAGRGDTLFAERSPRLAARGRARFCPPDLSAAAAWFCQKLGESEQQSLSGGVENPD